MEPAVRFTVSEFVASVNQTLEYALTNVVIVGEVSDFRINKGQWVRFKLKDQASSVDFFGSVYALKVPLEDGMLVAVQGSPRLSNLYGFSVSFRTIQPVGEGSIRRSFDLLHAKLTAEGLFDDVRKRPLPSLPVSIGLISSTQAAGYIDFTKILNNRWGGLRITVADTLVQGLNAPGQIIRAITYFNEMSEPPEVLVIVRGGGSADDLAAFNDEALVRAVGASRMPTLVGIGHEIDTTLVDLVADVRASTPSNAAERLVPDRREIIERTRNRVLYAFEAMHRSLRDTIDTLDADRRGAVERITARASTIEYRLRGGQQSLQALNPENVLRRGYGLLRAGGAIVTDPSGLAVGTAVRVELSRHTVHANVTAIEESE